LTKDPSTLASVDREEQRFSPVVFFYALRSPGIQEKAAPRRVPVGNVFPSFQAQKRQNAKRRAKSRIPARPAIQKEGRHSTDRQEIDTAFVRSLTCYGFLHVKVPFGLETVCLWPLGAKLNHLQQYRCLIGKDAKKSPNLIDKQQNSE
jgi:hypothetical protein